ncbi:MAG TPA: hypothetical protein VM073_00330 [Usitatibacter sp.]|nr:hypothetical protein [Usitatibacter sp.]
MEPMTPTTDAIDAGALAAALRVLNIFYGAERSLAEAVAGAANEAEAVRAYIRRERPHLLKCYDLEALVGLVLDARRASTEAPASIEAYRPA